MMKAEAVDWNLVGRLKTKAVQIRKQTCEMAHRVGSVHLGGSLSSCDIVVALYYAFLRYDPKNPTWPERDRFVVSKGHSVGCLYNILADVGFYDRGALLASYNKIGGRFGTHPNRMLCPGIEVSTGSLGHGLSIATGMALGGRMMQATWRVFCLTGDGELDAGCNWEAIMAAAHYQLGNLVAIVDRNGLQIDGTTEDVMTLEPLADKWRAFGWDTVSIDGNDMTQVVQAFTSLEASDSVHRRKPLCVIARTTKGRGVSFMENDPTWHMGTLDDSRLTKALEDIEREREARKP